MRAFFRNFRRAGVAKNRSRTTTRVPVKPEVGATAETWPPSTAITQAFSAPGGRDVICSRAAAPIEGSASPRNPSVVTRTSVSSASFEVAWRKTQSVRSSCDMPAPLSVTSSRSIPPPLRHTAIRVAPASSAFSTSSFAAAAGRSITSPAAMRLMVDSDSRRIGGIGTVKTSVRAEKSPN